MRGDPVGHLSRLAIAALLLCLKACAMVGVSRVRPDDVLNERRADLIGSGRLCEGTLQVLNSVALTGKHSVQSFGDCSASVEYPSGVNDERRLSALSELWLGRALGSNRRPSMDDATLDAYPQSARRADAYLS